MRLSEAIEQLKYYQSKPYVPTVKKVCNIALETIEALQQENEQLKDENASIRNWNACEEKLHNELLESDKRRWELESELEDANNYREGLEAIVKKLRAQVARMREVLEQFKYDYEQNCPLYQNYLYACQLLREDTGANYHNPDDVEALKKAREALMYMKSCEFDIDKAIELNKEALAEIDKAIGGKEDVCSKVSEAGIEG